MASAGSWSEPGTRYGPNLNQDHAVVQQALCAEFVKQGGHGGITVAAVLDGHGLCGERAAAAAGEALVSDVLRRATANGRNLLSQPHEKLAGAMTAAFEKAHQAALCVYDDPPAVVTYPCADTLEMRYTLYRPNGMPAYRADAARTSHPACDRLLECGTTATLAVLQGGQLCVANVGDSGAALVSLTGEGDVEACFLTTDHTGRHTGEAARIAAQHGHMARISEDRGYLSIFAGMWAGHELSVTRALGHKHLEAYGVCCEPSISLTQLQPHDACLIIASDGVWEVFDAREAGNRVMDVVSSGGSPQAAARQLVQDAVRLGACGPGGDVDNTTACVLVWDA